MKVPENSAIITFSHQEEALKALRSLKAVLDNRFIKIIWKNTPVDTSLPSSSLEEGAEGGGEGEGEGEAREGGGDVLVASAAGTVLGEGGGGSFSSLGGEGGKEKTLPKKESLKIVKKNPKEEISNMKTELRKNLLKQQEELLALLSKPNLTPSLKVGVGAGVGIVVGGGWGKKKKSLDPQKASLTSPLLSLSFPLPPLGRSQTTI